MRGTSRNSQLASGGSTTISWTYQTSRTPRGLPRIPPTSNALVLTNTTEGWNESISRRIPTSLQQLAEVGQQPARLQISPSCRCERATTQRYPGRPRLLGHPPRWLVVGEQNTDQPAAISQPHGRA